MAAYLPGTGILYFSFWTPSRLAHASLLFCAAMQTIGGSLPPILAPSDQSFEFSESHIAFDFQCIVPIYIDRCTVQMLIQLLSGGFHRSKQFVSFPASCKVAILSLNLASSTSFSCWLSMISLQDEVPILDSC